MIQYGLWCMCFWATLFAIVLILRGRIGMGLLLTVVAALYVCYAVYVQDRIPFAAANLRCASAALEKHPSMVGIAVGAIPVQVRP